MGGTLLVLSLVVWKCEMMRERSVVGVTVTDMEPSLDWSVSERVSPAGGAEGDGEEESRAGAPAAAALEEVPLGLVGVGSSSSESWITMASTLEAVVVNERVRRGDELSFLGGLGTNCTSSSLSLSPFAAGLVVVVGSCGADCVLLLLDCVERCDDAGC